MVQLSLLLTFIFHIKSFCEAFQWRHISRYGESAEECTRTQTSFPCSRHDQGMVQLNSSVSVFFGGYSYVFDEGCYNDVWLFYVEEEEWMYMKGGYSNFGNYGQKGSFLSTISPIMRGDTSIGRISEKQFFIYGGSYGYTSWFVDYSCYLSDLWVFDIEINMWKLLYGSSECDVNPDLSGFTTPPKTFQDGKPGARTGSTGHYNSETEEYFVFFGDNSKLFDCVWVFYESQPSGYQWKWVSGSNKYDSGPLFYSYYTPLAKPASRAYHSSWWHDEDSGEIMIYGGIGVSSTGGDYGRLGDIWLFDTISYNWKFHGGSKTRNNAESFASGENMYLYHSENMPKGRADLCAIPINNDEVILFGGTGASQDLSFNDLWIYSTSKNMFKFVSGSSGNELGFWGVNDYYSPSALPGSRFGASVVKKNEMEILMFYGKMCSTTSCSSKTLTDVWTFQFCPDCPGSSQCVEGVCKCQDGYVLDGDDCIPSCNPECNAETEVCVDVDQCGCKAGYSGDPCVYTCDKNCGNNTKCLLNETIWECHCLDGYEGDPYSACTKIGCNPKCGIHAECDEENKCKCEDNYYGNATNECFPDCSPPCRNNSFCSEPDVCKCNSGYKKDSYDVCKPMCENGCMDHSKCTEPDVCTCDEDYIYTIDYEGNVTCLPTCNNTKCHEHAECVAVDICRCLDNYFGDGVDCKKISGDDDDEDDERVDLSDDHMVIIISVIAGSVGALVCGLLLSTLVVGIVLCIVFGVITKRKDNKNKESGGITLGDISDDFTISNGALVPGSNSGKGEKEKNGSKRSSKVKSTAEMKLGEVHVIDSNHVRLIEEIGTGGSGARIFKAEWEGRSAAFKVFETKLFVNKAFLDDFERELKFVTTLSHPNIIQFYGVCLKDPRIGLVMEYAEKGDLVSFISESENERLSTDQKFNILQDIAMGMNYMHGRNIMHRDLKSPNVLLNEVLQAKIIDFGLSKIKEAGNQLQTKRVGTCHYMAPEVALGEKYDYKCDVFSFGIMIYEILLENFDPYNASKEGFIVEFKVANNPNFRPKITSNFIKCIQTPKNTNKFIVDLMKKCWSHESLDRPTFKEIADSFKAKKLALQETKKRRISMV